jgi:hypothetical protein
MLFSIQNLNDIAEFIAKVIALIIGGLTCAWFIIKLVLNNMYQSKVAAAEDRKMVEEKHKEFDERLQLQRADFVKLQNGIEIFQIKHLNDMELIKMQMEHSNSLMKDQSAMIKDIIHSVNNIRSWKLPDVVQMEVEKAMNKHPHTH